MARYWSSLVRHSSIAFRTSVGDIPLDLGGVKGMSKRVAARSSIAAFVSLRAALGSSDRGGPDAHVRHSATVGFEPEMSI